MSERDEYEELYSTLQFGETLIAEPAPDASIRPTMQGKPFVGSDTEPEADRLFVGSQSLPQISVSEDADAGVEILLHGTLGEGGMGLVRAAQQVPIGREVAVKTLRSDRDSDGDASLVLVQEAIATGRLEHPNVVPIYSVGRNEAGLPVIVMKRIDGASWRDHLKHPELIDTDDRLGWNLDIFENICTAVHFAHTRGIIHRDIKPDNVMIGEFGEVYLVDWGLALRLDPDPSGALPSVSEVRQVAGTPCYMAPEMAGGDFAELGTWSDVYLLGALLHEIVTGTMRHRGKALFEVMFAAYRSEPVDYDDSVPAELAAICNRATAREPAERFESALALREAVARFLEHRSAAALAADAAAQLAELRDAVADEDLAEDERRISVYRHFGAARFGFERSLAQWPENDVAQIGLRGAITTMIDWELSHGSVHSARALYAELDDKSGELLAKIEDVEEKLGAERAELEELRDFRHQRDRNVGVRSRGVMLASLVVFGVILPFLALWYGVIDITRPLTFWYVALFSCVVASAGMWAAWIGIGPLQIKHTETNRKMLFSAFVACGFLVVFRGAALLAGTGIAVEIGLELVSFSALTLAFGTAYDNRLFAMAPFYLTGGAAALAFPESALPIYGISHGLALGFVSVAWTRAREKTQETP